MLLKTWLEREKISQSAFAKRLGLSRRQVNRVCNGHSHLPMAKIELVKKLTNGEIDLNQKTGSKASPEKEKLATLSKPIQKALKVLAGDARIDEKCGFTFRGHKAELPRIVREANKVLIRDGMPLIYYPGACEPPPEHKLKQQKQRKEGDI